MTNNSNKPDMIKELYLQPQPLEEYWIPTKSKEEYIADISASIDSHERLVAFQALVELGHYRGQRMGGHYSGRDRDDIIALMERHMKDPALEKDLADLAVSEGCRCEKIGDFYSAVRFYRVSFGHRFESLRTQYFQLNNYAFCLNFLEMFGEAEKILRKAVEIAPRQYNAWKNLGVSLEHQGRFEEAADCYLKAIEYSRGEKRSASHLVRLVERYPLLAKVPAIAELFKNNE